MENDMAGAVRGRWVAGGSMPARLGYCNASSGLVVLEVAGSRLSLRLRPMFMAKLLGVNPLEAVSGDGIVISPGRSLWLRGIEFQRPGIRPYYFWTGSSAEIFSRLSDAGFTVSPAERE
jgi:hypothetical protein